MSYDRRRDSDRTRAPDRQDKSSTNLFIGGISSSTSESDLDKAFSKFGKVAKIQVKTGFAFVEYEDPRDASDAIKDLDVIHLSLFTFFREVKLLDLALESKHLAVAHQEEMVVMEEINHVFHQELTIVSL